MDDEPLRAQLQRMEAKLDAALGRLSEGGTGRYLLCPGSRIAAALGVHRRTLNKWATDRRHPLRVIHLGHGLATTFGLIDEWVKEKWAYEWQSPRVGKVWGRSRRAKQAQWKLKVRQDGKGGETEAKTDSLHWENHST